MLTVDYGAPYFWNKVVLTQFISGCRMVLDLICGTSWSEIWFVVPHGLISEEMKKLEQVESLPFCPIDAALFL